MTNRKEAVWEANRALSERGLILGTWGNASSRDETGRYLIIKPSGVSYDRLRPDDMVVVELSTGSVVEGTLVPSCDTPTHRCLYLAYPELGGIVHTHSTCATAWAQTGTDLPLLGTTAADYFAGNVPCTRPMTRPEMEGEYEWETGNVITETFRTRGISPMEIPAVLVASHGPFTWGGDCHVAVETATVLEQVAKMAFMTLQITPQATLDPELGARHFYRKHGSTAYYGQEKTS